jgi:hypothetical protein
MNLLDLFRKPQDQESVEEVTEEEGIDDFVPFVCRKCGKLVTSPIFEVCTSEDLDSNSK